MPAIFGVTTNGSQTVPYGAKLTSETDGVVTVELDPPSGDPGDVTFDPNPTSPMPTLPDGFVLPPVADAPDPGLIPGAIEGSPGDRGFVGPSFAQYRRSPYPIKPSSFPGCVTGRERSCSTNTLPRATLGFTVCWDLTCTTYRKEPFNINSNSSVFK